MESQPNRRQGKVETAHQALKRYERTRNAASKPLSGQSVAVTDSREDWHYGGRHYLLTLASTQDSMDLELDLVGDASGDQRPVLLASCDDESQDLTLSVFTSEPLPLDLIERFIGEARTSLPGRA